MKELALTLGSIRVFVEDAFRVGALHTTGIAIAAVLPPVSRFSLSGGHGENKQRVIEKLGVFFDRFFGPGVGETD